MKVFSRKLLCLFLLLLFLFFLNTFHEEYPDEYDSILGGRYILEGKVPYRDWFQHHQPFAYIFSAFLLIFSGFSFVRFRIVLSFAFFFLNIIGFLFLKKFFPKHNLSFYLLYLFFLGLSATYFWGQMLLADTLSAYLIVPLYALLLLKTIYQEKFGLRSLLFFSLFSFLAWLTSLTYIFLLGGLSLYALFLFWKSGGKLPTGVFLLLFPYLCFFLFLFFTGSLSDWYFANVIYNRYYIYNYPGPPGRLINPLRYALIIAHNFFNNFFSLLSSVFRFSFGDPLNITLGLSNTVFFLYLLWEKKYSFLLPFFSVLVYSNARSNPQAIRETDYQAGVYILTSALVGLFALFTLKKELDEKKPFTSRKILITFLFLILGVYWFFVGFFIPLKWWQKFHAKYMGQAPLIYDRPEIAPLVNRLVSREEYAWIGPFEFKELFYLQAKIPSKYHWFLQHAASLEKIKREMIADFEKKRPKVIVFDRLYAPWGGDPQNFNYFFVDFLQKHYFRLSDLNQEGKRRYRWTIANPPHFDLESDFNFSKEHKDELIKQLLALGLVEKVER